MWPVRPMLLAHTPIGRGTPGRRRVPASGRCGRTTDRDRFGTAGQWSAWVRRSLVVPVQRAAVEFGDFLERLSASIVLGAAALADAFGDLLECPSGGVAPR